MLGWFESNAAVAIAGAAVNVEFAGVAKSTWNFQKASWFALAPSATIQFGSPAGGSRAPSRSAGKRPPKEVLVVKHCCVAGCPASILARSYAHTREPRNCVPAALNSLKVW